MSQRILLLLLGLVFIAACAPALPGPQLRDPPPGLGYVSQVGERTGSLAGRPLTLARYWSSITEPPASLSISGYAGRLRRDELDAWIAASKQFDAQPALSERRIDGQLAWTWLDGTTPRRRAWAVVPYEDTTFVISLSVPGREIDDAGLLSAVASFQRDPGRAGRVLVPLVGIALVGLAVWAARRWRAPPPPPPVVARIVPAPVPMAGRR